MRIRRPRPPGRHRRFEDEAVRRRQLVEATLETIATLGFSATTVAEIAKRAGVSSGLVAFHFGNKDRLLEATLRHLSLGLARTAAARLREAATPRARVEAIVGAVLADAQFERRTSTVWLAFWGQVLHSRQFGRVQRAYQRRLASNLSHALRPLAGRQAPALAESLAAMIDGLWLRATLAETATDGGAARAMVMAYADAELRRIAPGAGSQGGPPSVRNGT